MRKILPDTDEKNAGSEEIKKPADKKKIPIKMIIAGSVGYIFVFGLMMVGMIMILKPDAPPLIKSVVFDKAANIDQATSPAQVSPTVSAPKELFLDDPANVDISDLVDELKEIEYKGRLREKMEQDSVARILAEHETKIARAKLEKLKLETAKIISARPRPIADNTLFSKEDNKSGNTEKIKVKGSRKNVKQLAKIYESMKPKDAAKILEQMESKLVVNLLTSMKNRSAAKILSSFKPKKAARISKQMSNLMAQI